MTKSQIKQELRRSACEDRSPWHMVHPDSLDAAESFTTMWHQLVGRDADDIRTFFLLVSEAINKQ